MSRKQLPVVVVLVDGAPTRCEVLENTLRKCRDVALFVLLLDRRGRPLWHPAPPPSEPFCALIHYDDFPVWVKAKVLARFLVYYGGGGGIDPRYRKCERRSPHERIATAIEQDGAGALSHEQLTQLVAYLRVRAEFEAGSRSTMPDKPRFLVGASSGETISALAILCQGHLAAYCESQDGKPAETEVRKALSTMRWPQIGKKSELSALRERLKAIWHAPIGASGSSHTSPRDAGWWLRPFGNTRSIRSTRIVDQLSQRLQEEWSTYPPAIGTLLGSIRNGSVIESAVVAKAYNVIARHLEKGSDDE